ncbi:Stk1 family PASTA domain-containing Ser/Thr kinase [Aeromicrobium sp.]|uniref:Stk1 family PASTA domain-containing Ser/Thr kinase n=1 Tax=Aeromicrobium sp. TaxID=1871063 RepID=UPI00198E509B|nr:Stk1 family PASTA domain-containing Ser/Thr kinase [Aeromicrobium sp.]MBC7632950.1 Stk1 family PASTA domain-containing Ser/Thr kinase [Aeromicrobium sp.]
MTESGDETIRLGDRYELGGLLGRGGMADVRVGRDLRLGRTVAVKQLRSDLSADDTFQARFRREAQSSAALNHPSIVAVYDTGESIDKHGSHVPYIVMEYVEGQTLRDILRGAENGRKILPERALSITADVLSALDYSHRSGIIHRDIKPANVMLTPSGQVKVMDFGIARAIADTSSAMTATAAVIGTAQYLSPEQARGETVDARSDIYSTGCLLYELLTGRPPFIGDSPVSVAYQHVREEARPPSQLNPDVSETIDRIVAKSLAKRVEDRYQSASDMRKDIERAIAGHQVDAPMAATAVGAAATSITPAVAAVPVAGGARRAVPDEDEDEDNSAGNGKWWLIGLIALLLLGGLAFGIFKATQPEPTTPQRAVTDVAGKDVETATRALENADFVVGKVTRQTSSAVDKDLVIETNPPAGERVDVGKSINLIVSAGPEQVTMPDVRELQFDVAKSQLQDGDGQFKVIKKNIDNTADRGVVINSTPLVGQQVDVGSKVTLFVSRGQVRVPNLVGKDIKDAKDSLDTLGLRYTTTDEPTSTEPKNTVTAQSLADGTMVPPGTSIELTVSTNPGTPPPTTPTTDPNATADLGGVGSPPAP